MRLARLTAVVATAFVISTGGLAVAAPPPGDWIESGFDAANTHYNPTETVLSPANVGQLVAGYNIPNAASRAPALVGGRLYTTSGAAVNAFNAATGAPAWSFPAPAGKSFSGAPAVAGGVVYAAASSTLRRGFLYAIDAATGNQRWKVKVPNAGDWPLVVANATVYVPADNQIFAIDTATHAVKWTFTAPLGTSHRNAVTRPAIVGAIVYVASLNHKVYALDAATGAIKWKYTAGDEFWSSPTVSHGALYIGSQNGLMYALDATAGTKLWSYTTLGNGFTDAAVAGNTIYFGSHDGSIYALSPTGRRRWKFTTSMAIAITDPVVANGVVYGSSYDKYVYALDAGTGQKLWSFYVGVSPVENIVVSNGALYAGFPNARLRNFHLP